MFNKKYKVIFLEVFLIILGILGLTLGYNYITNINIGTSSLAIDDMNANVTNGTLIPLEDSSINVNTTSNVLRITFDVKGASTNTKNNIIYDVVLNLDASCELKKETVKWNLYKNNNLLSTGNISPLFDSSINENKLVLTNTQEDLPTYSSTSDKYVFILWMSESCTEEDITKCDLSKTLSSNMGNKNISGNIDIRLNTGRKKPLTRVPSDSEICRAVDIIKGLDDGTSGDSGSGVYKVSHDEIGADVSVTGEVIPASVDYRYYGANPDNYICLDYEGSTICPDKHLYRIIGSIYDELEGTNKLKVIKATTLKAGDGSTGTVMKFAWNQTTATYNASNASYRQNIWAPVTDSTMGYSNAKDLPSTGRDNSGSTLMEMLNSEGEKGLWWGGKSGIMYYYDNSLPGVQTKTVDFSGDEYKMESDVLDMISTTRYYLAGHRGSAVITTTMYTYERTTTGNNNGRYDENRPYYWDGKVAVMYPSDYGYAAGEACATGTNLGAYSSSCKSTDWLLNTSQWQWLLSPDSSFIDFAFVAHTSGGGTINGVDAGGSVRPVFSLTPDVIITGGDGTIDNPYTLSGN